MKETKGVAEYISQVESNSKYWTILTNPCQYDTCLILLRI